MYQDLSYTLKGVDLNAMKGGLGDKPFLFKPAYFGPDFDTYPEDSTSTDDWDTWNSRAGDILDNANKAWCLLDPDRCRQQAETKVIMQEQKRNNALLYGVGALVLLLIVILILKK